MSIQQIQAAPEIFAARHEQKSSAAFSTTHGAHGSLRSSMVQRPFQQDKHTSQTRLQMTLRLRQPLTVYVAKLPRVSELQGASCSGTRMTRWSEWQMGAPADHEPCAWQLLTHRLLIQNCAQHKDLGAPPPHRSTQPGLLEWRRSSLLCWNHWGAQCGVREDIRNRCGEHARQLWRRQFLLDVDCQLRPGMNNGVPLPMRVVSPQQHGATTFQLRKQL